MGLLAILKQKGETTPASPLQEVHSGSTVGGCCSQKGKDCGQYVDLCAGFACHSASRHTGTAEYQRNVQDLLVQSTSVLDAPVLHELLSVIREDNHQRVLRES